MPTQPWVSVLSDAFGRNQEIIEAMVPGLSREQLRWRPTPEANPIGWLVWHAMRVQDDHLAPLIDEPQVYVSGGWHERVGAEFDDTDTGYGHGPDEVGRFDADPDALVGYATAVHERALQALDDLADDDVDRVVDDTWDPPVTLGVRLVSVVNDVTQHIGQAAYVQGLLPD